MHVNDTGASSLDTLSDTELFQNYIDNPTVENRNLIVSKYLYLASILTKKFLNRGVDYDDIYQVASIALIKSVERFNLDRGVKFVSFATPTIIGEIKRFFRDKSSIIRIPRRIYEDYQKVNMAREFLNNELERPPRIDEIAEYLGMSEENVIEIVESKNVLSIKSFDQTAFADDDIELHEMIGDEDDSFEKIENRDFLNRSLDRFNDVEKQFIKMRYYDNKTQKIIADKLGVSQMFVSRLEKKVLARFKTILEK